MSDDDLRNVFTAYIQKVIRNAKVDYIRRKAAQIKMEAKLGSLERRELSYEQDFNLGPQDGFSFGNGYLADDFASLSPTQQQILTLLIVQGYSPTEVAKMLNRPVSYVYDQKRYALHKLREQMEGGEEDDL